MHQFSNVSGAVKNTVANNLELLEMLAHEDELTILELLDISSDDLVAAFRHKLKARRDYVSQYFDEELSPEEKKYGYGMHIETWEDQIQEEENY